MLHQANIQLEQLRNEQLSQLQQLKDELKNSKQKFMELSLMNQSEVMQRQVAESKVTESETKINTLQQQVYKLITQIDSLKSKAFEAEEKHQQELSELRAVVELLSQKEQLHEKTIASDGQQPSESESKLLARIQVLETKCKHLSGKELDSLEQQQLDELEKTTQETLRSISAAKVHLNVFIRVVNVLIHTQHSLLLKQVEALKKANDKLLEQQQCPICAERNIDTVLLPCRHRCICAACSKTLEKCPLCRQLIAERIELYN